MLPTHFRFQSIFAFALSPLVILSAYSEFRGCAMGYNVPHETYSVANVNDENACRQFCEKWVTEDFRLLSPDMRLNADLIKCSWEAKVISFNNPAVTPDKLKLREETKRIVSTEGNYISGTDKRTGPWKFHFKSGSTISAQLDKAGRPEDHWKIELKNGKIFYTDEFAHYISPSSTPLPQKTWNPTEQDTSTPYLLMVGAEKYCVQKKVPVGTKIYIFGSDVSERNVIAQAQIGHPANWDGKHDCSEVKKLPTDTSPWPASLQSFPKGSSVLAAKAVNEEVTKQATEWANKKLRVALREDKFRNVDKNIVALYEAGITGKEIAEELENISYILEGNPNLRSIINQVKQEIKEEQSRYAQALGKFQSEVEEDNLIKQKLVSSDVRVFESGKRKFLLATVKLQADEPASVRAPANTNYYFGTYGFFSDNGVVEFKKPVLEDENIICECSMCDGNDKRTPKAQADAILLSVFDPNPKGNSILAITEGSGCEASTTSLMEVSITGMKALANYGDGI